MKIAAFFLLASAFSMIEAFVPQIQPRPTSRIGMSKSPGFFQKIFSSSDVKEEAPVVAEVEEAPVVEEAKGGSMNMMSEIKAAGAAGAVSLFLWEGAFWAISIPVAIAGYVSVTGSYPDFSNKEDVAKVGAEAFAFANVARFALPLRIGLAVSTTPWVRENIVETPWVQENIVDRFKKEE